MAGNYISRAYLYIGGTFSVFYVTVGLLLCTGRLKFDMDPQVRVLVGAGVMAYGIFRAIVFYRKYKEYKQGQS